MDNYILGQLSVAKELLETGVQLEQPKSVLKAINVYDNLKPIVRNVYENGGKTDYWENVVENMVRACSVMCIYDPINAKTYLDQASKYDDDHPVILNNYGYVYHTRYGDWEKSISHYERCLLKDPKYTTAYLGIIDVYRTLRHHKIELEYCKKGANACPDSPEILNSLGLSLLHNHKYRNMDAIFSCFRSALDKNPNDETRSKICVNIGHVHGILGDFSRAIHFYLQAIDADPKHQPAYGNILLNLHYYCDLDFGDPSLTAVMDKFAVVRNKGETIANVVAKLHSAIVKTVYGSAVPEKPSFVVEPTATRKIRVAYMSADLVEHAVSYFSKALFTHYNRDCFDVYVYANNIYDPNEIATIPCTAYRCVRNASTKEVVAQLKIDAIDVLVDLSSHTAGNRLDVVAARPVPVVLSYLGYPDDSGFPYVRRISDVYTERCNPIRYENDVACAPIRLQRLFLCYEGKNVPAQWLKSFANFKPKESLVTYGCFAKLQKINRHVINAWIEILSRVPASRLLLKSRYFEDPQVAERWKGKFVNERHDVRKRVHLLKGASTTEQHMSMFRMIDIHLDTFPYSGTTITTESLYMNVPVVTLSLAARSVGHVQRVSGSILSSMGFDKDLVATNVNDYVDKAVSLVNELPHLPSVRKRMLNSGICDSADFMKHYEMALSETVLASS